MKISGLYVVTDEALSLGRDTLIVVEEALKGGAMIIQLRDKCGSTREMVELGHRLKALTEKYNALLIINDRIDVAMAVNAHGVHVGQSDMCIDDARRILGPDYIIGLSVTSYEEFLEAKNSSADYLGVGPVFATSSKDDAAEPLGLDMLKRIASESNLPIVAIGGINMTNAKSVIESGADSIAVISAVVSAPDIRKASENLSKFFD